MIDTSLTLCLGILLIFITLSAIDYFTDYETFSYLDNNIWITTIIVVLMKLIIKFSGNWF